MTCIYKIQAACMGSGLYNIIIALNIVPAYYLFCKYSSLGYYNYTSNYYTAHICRYDKMMGTDVYTILVLFFLFGSGEYF